MKKITLLLLLISAFSFGQTNVNVTYYTGSPQTFVVTTDGELYFTGDDLNIKIDATAAITTIPTSIIEKITFGAALGTESFGENENGLVLFPNPTTDFVKITSNNAENLMVKIYTMNGKLVQNGNYKSNENINVSNLSTGIYLIQVNGLTFKFSKK